MVLVILRGCGSVTDKVLYTTNADKGAHIRSIKMKRIVAKFSFAMYLCEKEITPNDGAYEQVSREAREEQHCC